MANDLKKLYALSDPLYAEDISGLDPADGGVPACILMGTDQVFIYMDGSMADKVFFSDILPNWRPGDSSTGKVIIDWTKYITPPPLGLSRTIIGFSNDYFDKSNESQSEFQVMINYPPEWTTSLYWYSLTLRTNQSISRLQLYHLIIDTQFTLNDETGKYNIECRIGLISTVLPTMSMLNGSNAYLLGGSYGRVILL